jgi:hypothetical protein
MTGTRKYRDAARTAVEMVDGGGPVKCHLTVMPERGDMLKARRNATLLYG